MEEFKLKRITKKRLKEISDNSFELDKKIACLSDLFNDWKGKQNEEDEKSCAYTFPKGVSDSNFKSNFCKDGPLNDNFDVEILFICRESNVGGKVLDNEEKALFWFKKVVEAKQKGEYFSFENRKMNPPDFKTQTTYANCMSNIATTLGVTNDKDKPYENLNKCAYMNINKRGGTSSCHLGRLEAYFRKYEKYILKEIELINPNKIVILGNLPIYIQDKIKSKNKDIEVYVYSRHPSRYIKNDIEIFKSQLKKENN